MGQSRFLLATWFAAAATFVRVVTSEQSICALDTTGTRWCWGDDSVGELGDNRAWTTAFAPVSLP